MEYWECTGDQHRSQHLAAMETWLQSLRVVTVTWQVSGAEYGFFHDFLLISWLV